MNRIARRLAVVTLVLVSIHCPASGQQGGTRTPNGYALVIGVSNYPNLPPSGQLRYPAADATLFAEFLKTTQGGRFPASRVILLRDSSATRANIYQAMYRLAQQVSDRDVVYVFFAGHGIKDETDNAVYLMPYDGDATVPGALGIRADEFIERVKVWFPAHMVVAFIDACYSGAALTPGGLSRGGGDVPSELQRLWARTIDPDNASRMAFISARPGQVSWESEELRHGVFTWFLVQGLKGAANVSPNDSIVNADEIARFLQDSVQTYSLRKFGHRQSPLVSTEFTPEFALAYAPLAQGAPTPTTPSPSTPVGGGQMSTRGFLPIPSYNEVPVRTSDWVQIRGWTVYYRYALLLGKESDQYSAKCTPDLRIVGDWGWDWTNGGIGVTCLDDEWLSFDLSRMRTAFQQPMRVNIRDSDGVWGLHGNTRFLVPCLLSETGSSNLVFQADRNGLKLAKLTSVPADDEWISDPKNRRLDVCQGGHVAVTTRPGSWPFEKPR